MVHIRKEILESMDKKAKDQRRFPSKSSLILRAIAGGYMIYLAYMIFSDLKGSGEENSIVFVFFAVFFVLSGFFLAIISLLAIKQGKYQNGSMDSAVTGEKKDIESDNSANRLEFGEKLDEKVYQKESDKSS